jgi:hypothetical protein
MKLLITALALFGFLGVAHGEETTAEKAEAAGKSGKRAAKKSMHRTKEAACGKLTGDSKAECLAKKGKNRAEEGRDATKDKASELKNDADSEKNSNQ